MAGGVLVRGRAARRGRRRGGRGVRPRAERSASIPEDAIFDSPAAAVEASPSGWIAVRGTLLVARDGFVQLCAEVVGDACRDGAVVRGIDGVRLLLNVTDGPEVTAYEEPQLWIGRVDDGVLDDIAGLLGIQD